MEYNDEIKYVYLFERPTEPLYAGPRGNGSTKYLYNLPSDYLEPFELQAAIELRKMIPPGTNLVEIPVYRTATPYDLKPIQDAVPKFIVFSDFNKGHLQASADLTNILLSQPTKGDFFNASALCRDKVNTHLWIHAFFRATMRRSDMRGFRFPAIWEAIPDMFIEARPWKQAVIEATLPAKDRGIIVIDKNFSGTNLDPHHRVAYFTEDTAGNAHHWHWHIVNPFNLPKGTADRKGEIFYYMHHCMLGRYDAERLANALNRVKPFDIHENVVEEACFSKLTIQNSSTDFADRQENSVLKDLDRSRDPQSGIMGFQKLEIVRLWADRIIDAVDAGFAIQEGGGRVDLRNDKGIDVITAMWESSNDSPNLNYYGSVHNYVHWEIGMVHDPDFRYRAPPSPMCFTGTSMRDPIFYRWHKYLDLISQRLKDYLPPYTQENLQWNGIRVNDIKMIRLESNAPMSTLDTVNNMVTHWMQSDVELSRGLDFGRTSINGLGSVWIRLTHLQHVPFQYRIRVTSQARGDVQATVRIFLAPKLDENGDLLPFYEQRILFFEMDKFTTILHPGENTIVQNSADSTLIVPWTQTFREIEGDDRPTRAQAICSCGWPEHLLLPRGKSEGMLFDLFVMLTNTQIDQVPNSRRQLGTLTAKGTCRDSISFCGVIDDKFPDSRPMGYPFDRPASAQEVTQSNMFLADFTAPVTNMLSTEVIISHVNKTTLRGNGAPETMRKIFVAP